MFRLILLALGAFAWAGCARNTAQEEEPSLRELARERYVAQRFGVWFDWPGAGAAMIDAPQWVELARKAGAQYVTLRSPGGEGLESAAAPAHDPLRELSAAAAEAGLDFYVAFDASGAAFRDWDGDSRARFEKSVSAALERCRPVSGVWIGAPLDTGSQRRRLEKWIDKLHRRFPDLMVGQEGGAAPVRGADMWRSGADSGADDDFHDPALDDETVRDAGAVREYRRPARLRAEETSVERARLILRDLIRAVGRDANFQIEVAPGADGQISNPDRFTLLEIGDWFETYGESVHGTRGGPARPGDWGVTTQKNSKIYVHYLGRNAGALTLDRDLGEVAEAYQFSSGATLDCVPRDGVYEIPIPAWLPHPVSGVIALEIAIPDARLP